MLKFKKNIVLMVGILLLLTLLNVQPSEAQDILATGAMWTTDTNCATQNKNSYAVGEAIWLAGANLDPSVTYRWAINEVGGGPGGTEVVFGNVTPDSDGTFCFNAHTFTPGDTINNPYKAQADSLDGTVKVKSDNFTISGSVVPSSFSYQIGACSWTAAGGSVRVVTLTLTGVSVTISKTGGGTYGPYTTSQNINLPAGEYTYAYTVLPGYTGTGGSGGFTVEECPPATVSVVPQGCEWDPTEETSSEDVVLTINNATLNITGPNAYDETFTSSQTITLPPGTYSYSWTANAGYSGSGSGSFTLLDCEPGKGDASVEVGACEWDATNGSLINVIITLEDAALTINGQTYTESTEIKLSPGTYAYSWVATGDNEGSGSGTITVYGCEPASVAVDVGGCEWDGAKSVTDVTLTISGATLTIFQDSVAVGTYTTSQVISLPEGEYTYTWEALENYTGSGSGSFTLVNCEPGVASASVALGACVYANNTSLTPVTITLNFATLTINGETYTESIVIQLEPGEYDYTWVASDEEHVGEGSGTLVVEDCAPKDEETPDPVPDVAAGGQGPTLFSIFTPIFAAITGLFVAWSVLKNKVMKNR